MNQIKLSILTLFSFVLLFAACSGGGSLGSSDDTLSFIPKDVSMVTKVDVKTLLDKMDFKAVQKMEFYQEGLNEMRGESKIGAKIMEDPRNSGIDISKNLYFAYDIDSKTIGNVFAYATASMADQSKFEAMLKEANLTFKQKEGYQIAKPDKKQIVAWNDQMVVVGSAQTFMDIEASVEKIFTTDPENSILTDPNFKKNMSAKHDITNWFSSNAIAENGDAKMAVGFANIKPDALKDNYSYGYVDFNDGSINAESGFDINNEIANEIGLFFKDHPKTNFSKYIPMENLGMGMTAALDLKGINQVLSERPQAKSMANFALRKYGVEIDQVFKALGGDISLSFYGDENATETNGKGLFATNIADQTELINLLNIAVDFGAVEKVSETEYVVNRKMTSKETNIVLHDGLLLMAEDMSLIEKVKNGDTGSSKLGKEIKNLSGDNIFALIGNLNSFGGNSMKALEGFGGENFKMTTDRKKGTFDMDFADKNTNSLNQMMKALNQLYLEDQKKKGTSM